MERKLLKTLHVYPGLVKKVYEIDDKITIEVEQTIDYYVDLVTIEPVCKKGN